jgi:hypothetical protein
MHGGERSASGGSTTALIGEKRKGSANVGGERGWRRRAERGMARHRRGESGRATPVLGDREGGASPALGYREAGVAPALGYREGGVGRMDAQRRMEWSLEGGVTGGKRGHGRELRLRGLGARRAATMYTAAAGRRWGLSRGRSREEGEN